MGRDYRVHLDGYNILPLLTGETDESPRKEIFYFTDDGDLTALRYADWKITFLEQKEWATLRAWIEPLHAAAHAADVQPAPRSLRAGLPHVEHLLRLDDRPRLHAGAGAGLCRQFLATFQEFPPRQEGGELQPRQGDGEALAARRRAVAPRRIAAPEPSPGRRPSFSRARPEIEQSRWSG
jgi:hypothetical protein